MIDVSSWCAFICNFFTKFIFKERKIRKSARRELDYVQSELQRISNELRELIGPQLYTKKQTFDEIRYDNICRGAKELVDSNLQNCCTSLKTFTKECALRNDSIDKYIHMWETAG